MINKKYSPSSITILFFLLICFEKGLAQQPGDIKTICGQTIPDGWICINVDVNSLCPLADPYGGPGSYTRTIEYYKGLPPGSKINMSADVVPTGWVKTTLSLGPALPAIIDGKPGTSIYYNSTLEKVEGLETSDSIMTVDQVNPPGWIGSISGGQLVGASIYMVRPIYKIDKMDPTKLYKMDSSVPPPGWLITGFSATPQIGKSIYQLCIIQNHLNLPTGSQITAIDNGFYNGPVVPDGWTTDATGQIVSFATIYNTYTISKKESRVSGPINGGIWTKSGSPYVLTGTVNIPADNVLTIQPGVVAKFSNSSVNLIVDGALDAQGRSTDSIYFRGIRNGTSLRGGYVNLNGAGSILKYVSIDSLDETSYANAAVNIADGLTPTVSNTTIRNSGTSDVYTLFDGVKNFSNFNGIIGTPGGSLSEDKTLLKISGNNSYKLLSTLTIPAGKKLTIQPGVRLIFNSLVSLSAEGKLDAQGSSTDSIYFKGIKSSGNYRGGYVNLNSDSSVLSYISLDSLGDSYYASGTIQIPDGITPTIKNTAIRNSGTADIYSWIGGAKNLVNINGVISIPGGSLSKDATMPKVGGSSYYKLLSTLTIPAGKKLTIQPGVRLTFNSLVSLSAEGKLDAQGNAADSIYFKGTATSPSYRGGYINLNNDSSTLTYLSLDSLGDSYYASGTIQIPDGITPNIKNTSIRRSGTADIYSWIGGAKNMSNINGVITIPGGSLSKDAVVPKVGGNSYYKLLSTLTIPVKKTLTIQPGVRLVFNSLVSLSADGKLNAQGSSSDSIYFKGTKSSGNYRGGYINLNSDSSTLKYISLDSLGDSYYASGTIQIADGMTPTITNMSIWHSGTEDIYSWIGGAKNIANINGLISIPGGSLSKDAIMPKVGGNSYYKLLSTMTIPTGKKLTIQAGVRVSFYSLVSLFVDGKLDAQGSSTDSIYFKGTATSGTYRGGYINLNSDSSMLGYVSIDSLGDSYYASGSVQVSDGITPTLKNTTVRRSGTADIYSWIGGAKNFVNINGVISIPGGSLSKDATMPKVGGSSYYKLLSTLTIPAGKKLTIQPGVQLIFNSLVSLSADGKLDAQGSSTDSIYFKGTKTSGNYRGGYINLNSDSSVLKYISLDSLGDSYYATGTIQMTAKSTISNSTIKNSGTAGVYTSITGSKISDCAIIKNSTGILVTTGKPTLSNNSIYGNTDYGINNIGTADTVDATYSYWGTTSGPYHPTQNPSGTGNKVSDRVKFIPWKNQMDSTQCTLTASSTVTPVKCYGDSGTVIVAASGGTLPYSGTGTFKVKAGTYTYTVTDAKGCKVTTTAIVTQPANPLTATANAGTISCNGGSTTVTVTASGGTTPYTGTGTFTVKAGSYSYTVKDANGCTTTASGSIAQPTLITVTATPGTIACHGGTTTVTVTASGGTPPYSSGTGTFTTVAGAYTYTVTDSRGCTGIKTMTITEPTSVTASVADVYAVNPGGAVNTIYIGYGATSLTYKAIAQGGSAGYKYSWKDESTNKVIATTQSVKVSPSVVGTYRYTVTVTDKKGCVATPITKVVTVKDVRCGTNQITICKVDDTNGSQTICISKSKVSSYLSSGSYLGSCSSAFQKSSSVIENLIVKQEDDKETLKIYPNPSTGIFTLQLGYIKADKAEIYITDQKGVVVTTKVLQNLQGIQTEHFDLSHVASGVYLIRVTTRTDVKVARIVITH